MTKFPPTICESEVRAVLTGEVERIAGAFFWTDTEQGPDHWAAIEKGKTKLTDADREYLNACLIRFGYVERPAYFNKRHVQSILDGDLSRLWYAFEWSTTPQGDAYWRSRAEGHEPLSPTDREYLTKLMGLPDER